MLYMLRKNRQRVNDLLRVSWQQVIGLGTFRQKISDVTEKLRENFCRSRSVAKVNQLNQSGSSICLSVCVSVCPLGYTVDQKPCRGRVSCWVASIG